MAANGKFDYSRARLAAKVLSLVNGAENWLLEFSIEKCKLVQYRNVKYDFEYKLKDKHRNMQALPKDTKEKDLGIWFQNNLKFDEYISYIMNRANRLVGLIRRTFKSLKSSVKCK